MLRVEQHIFSRHDVMGINLQVRSRPQCGWNWIAERDGRVVKRGWHRSSRGAMRKAQEWVCAWGVGGWAWWMIIGIVLDIMLMMILASIYVASGNMMVIRIATILCPALGFVIVECSWRYRTRISSDGWVSIQRLAIVADDGGSASDKLPDSSPKENNFQCDMDHRDSLMRYG